MRAPAKFWTSGNVTPPRVGLASAQQHKIKAKLIIGSNEVSERK